MERKDGNNQQFWPAAHRMYGKRCPGVDRRIAAPAPGFSGLTQTAAPAPCAAARTFLRVRSMGITLVAGHLPANLTHWAEERYRGECHTIKRKTPPWGGALQSPGSRVARAAPPSHFTRTSSVGPIWPAMPLVAGDSVRVDASRGVVDCYRDRLAQQDDCKRQCRADDRKDDHVFGRRSTALVVPKAVQKANCLSHIQSPSSRVGAMELSTYVR